MTVVVVSSSIASASASTTLKTYRASEASTVEPYEGTIVLHDNERNSVGKRALTYRIALRSSTCSSILEGSAFLSAVKDEMGDDSAFLRNGDVVKTNIFRGKGIGGDVTIIMDVESKKPRYAGVSVDKAPIIAGGCAKEKKFDIDFY
ncbi:hypothetical protein IAG25_37720 [Caballeronia sp. EK]|uniref:hypothetical protein n=1 Tax=Caballeronia sp. EK TaxID=2767469 RepID=UPI00199157B4|nr:hypothetical protein [Caballeronia sp. EK]MBC8642545.1 hypothetical protein [Caballeronia sp. EK]